MTTVGEKLVDLLSDYGVDMVFGIPGTHSIELYRGLGSGKIEHISPRHEQGGGFMADGYARVSGKPGVCFVITGPGVTNLTTPIGEAYMDSVPMLVISPVNEPDPNEYNQGRLHEITNQSKVTQPLTAFSATVTKAEQVPELIKDAFRVFRSERPRPVHINIPLSIIREPVTAEWQADTTAAAPCVKDSELKAALALITNAQNPILILGGGCSQYRDEMISLGESIPCPIVTTVAGRGVIPPDHPLTVGAQLRAPYVQELLEQSDLAIFMGTEFSQTYHWNDDLKLPENQIWINLNPGVLKGNDQAMLLIADTGDTARRLNALLPAPAAERVASIQQICRDTSALKRRDLTAKERQHLSVLNEVMRVLPEKANITTDMTQIAYTAVDYLTMDRPNRWLHPTGYGTLGYALPAAIGAILADRSHPALAIVGDGGIQYTFQEMTLASELALNLVVLLWNNDALLQINDDMDNAGIKPVGVRQKNPDFIKLAESCGWQASKIDSMKTLPTQMEQAFAQPGPVLLQLDQNIVPLVPAN
ncbi:MAG: 5-guanidino-2-oxopentanoate decarboxylase [Pseudomonadota bacterium]